MEILGYAFIIFGAIVAIFSIAYALTINNFWQRIHALSLLDVVVFSCVILGMILLLGIDIKVLKLLVVLLVMVFISPINSYVLSQIKKQETAMKDKNHV